MLPLTICLLLITQTFANDLAPREDHQIELENVSTDDPTEFFDSINLPNPDYKFSFNYEQKRTDEAPQIDQVEEKIGKYMHFEPSTSTTTETQPKTNEFNEVFKDLKDVQDKFKTPIVIVLHTHHTHHHHHKVNEVAPMVSPLPSAPKLQPPSYEPNPYFAIPEWNYWNYYNPIFPADMPFRPDAPQWEQLNENLKHLPRPHFPAHVPASNSHKHSSHQEHISSTTETPVSSDKETEHAKESTTHKHSAIMSHHVPSLHSQLDEASTKVNPVHHSSFGAASQHVYRGNRKFSWDDINDANTSAVPRTNSPKVSQLKKNAPPSVPTLSPWYDGFGK